MKSRVLLDVPYGGDYWQRMDIYLPPQDGLRDLPVLLFLHGGGALVQSVACRIVPDYREG
jgi:acetyl esterase/lipase